MKLFPFKACHLVALLNVTPQVYIPVIFQHAQFFYQEVSCRLSSYQVQYTHLL